MIMFDTACAKSYGLTYEVGKTLRMFESLENSVVTGVGIKAVLIAMNQTLRAEGGDTNGYSISHIKHVCGGKIELKLKGFESSVAFAFYRNVEHFYECENYKLVECTAKYEKFAKKGGKA